MTINIAPQPIVHTPIASRLPILKVVGLGGAGCNAINRMIEIGFKNVEFIAANTDAQVLKTNLAPTKIQLGPHLTRGLGAGGVPATGEAAAEESYRELSRALDGADMVFLTAGMGGGTGTGSIPIAARVARSLGAIVIAVVSTPFSFEAGRRQRNAIEGLTKLQHYTDTMITIPNDKLVKLASQDMTMEMAFRLADDILRQGVQGISELVTESGMINVDFAHIRHMMLNGKGALLTIGVGSGENKAMKAIENALNHPLLDSINLDSSTGIIANFSGGSDLTFIEVSDALSFIQEKTNNHAEIIPGVINDDRMNDRAQVILIITGIGATSIDKHSQTKSCNSENLNQIENNQSADLPFNEVEENFQTELDIPAFLRRRIK